MLEKIKSKQRKKIEKENRENNILRKEIKMSKIQTMYEKMGISPAVYEYGELIVGHLKERFAKMDETAEYNQLKVLHAMQEERVGEACLMGTTGYGYNDLGRVPWRQCMQGVFHTEDALVRPQITCGTHACPGADEQPASRRDCFPRWASPMIP